MGRKVPVARRDFLKTASVLGAGLSVGPAVPALAQPASDRPIATGGDLLFAGGTNDRLFRAFDAKTGKILWEYPTISGVAAVPVSFQVDGKQYIAVQSGWGPAGRRRLCIRLEVTATIVYETTSVSGRSRQYRRLRLCPRRCTRLHACSAFTSRLCHRLLL